MNDQYNPEDDFLRKIIGMAGDEKAPAGFTQKVMTALPAEETAAQRPFAWKPLLGYLLSAIALIAALVWFMTQLDFSLLNMLQLSGLSANFNYLSNTISIFREGFAGFEFTSLTATIILSILLLLLADTLIKKILHRNFNFII